MGVRCIARGPSIRSRQARAQNLRDAWRTLFFFQSESRKSPEAALGMAFRIVMQCWFPRSSDAKEGVSGPPYSSNQS